MSVPGPDDPIDTGLPDGLGSWLDDLRSAQETVPELDLVLAKAAFETRDLDAELVALWDSREHDAVLQRGDADEWQLALAVGEVDVVVTVVPAGAGRRLVGAVTGDDAVVLHVEGVSGRTSVELDDLGRFDQEVAAGPLRVHCATSDGAAAVSGWITV